MSRPPVPTRITGEIELLEPDPGEELPPHRFTRRLKHELAEQLVDGWQYDALCAQADPEAWFPEVGQFAAPEVIATCGRCLVRRPCLATAVLGGELGVWAGTTREHRRVLYRLLRHGAPVADVLDHALGDEH